MRQNQPLQLALASMAIYAGGSQLLSFALPWYVMKGTGSLASMALIWGVQTFAIGVSGIGLGWIVDRYPAARVGLGAIIVQGTAIVIMMQTLRALHPSSVALATWSGVWAIGSSLYGLTTDFQIVPRLARSESELTWANGLYGSLWSGSAVAGPALGGVLVVLMPQGAALWVVLGTLALMLPWIWVIRDLPAGTKSKSDRQNIKWDSRPGRTLWLGIGLLGAAAALANIGTGSLSTVTTYYLGHTLNLPSPTVGVLFSVGAVAQVVASLVGPLIYNRMGAQGTRFLYTVFGIFVLLMLILVGSWWAGLGYAVTEVALSGFNLVSRTVRQQWVPSSLRGWAAGVYRTTAVLPAPLSAVVLLSIYHNWGYGCVLLVAAVAFVLNWILAARGIYVLSGRTLRGDLCRSTQTTRADL
jgi:hypothetical protein